MILKNLFIKIRPGIIYFISMRQLRLNRQLDGNAVYLTFDDGPEPGITEFVLEELSKYDAKATFFCTGKNIEKYPSLLTKIKEKGHGIGSHSYSHIHAHYNSSEVYLGDVDRFDRIMETPLFRPPWGALTLKTYLKLRKNKEIVLWHLSSNDFALDKFDLYDSLNNLKQKTAKGKIVLFHFSNRHEKETRLILPLYLEWLSLNKYKMLSL